MPKDSNDVVCRHCNRKVSRRTERRHRMLPRVQTSPGPHLTPARHATQVQAHTDATKQLAPGISTQNALANLRAQLSVRRERSCYMNDESDENEGNDNDRGLNPYGVDLDTLRGEDHTSDITWLDLNGLTARETLGLNFERRFADICRKPLSSEDQLVIDAFNYRMHTNIPSNAAALLPFAFQDQRLADLPSLYHIQLRTATLSGVVPVLFDRCKNSCVCYTGDLKDCSTCPYCRAPRFKPDGTPAAKPFSYLPLIPRLKAAMANTRMRRIMSYRAAHQHNQKEGQITDVFDGSHYRNLLSKLVCGARKPGRRFFEDARDVALGLSTDGFCPFKRRKMTCWPILIYNLNLPPEIRFQLENIICLGVIPGPKAVKDIETFLYPLIEELFELMHGVAAYDVEQDEMFILCAFLILAFGDIPAISKLMSMKGHNGKAPCRACEIVAIRAPDSQNSAHYTPLHRSASCVPPSSYDPLHLPLRTHTQMMSQAQEVIKARSNAEEKRLATQYGIKRVPLLSLIPSLDFPTSFPYDFMHLVWEGVIPNLLSLWTGEFKGLDEGVGSYQFTPTVFEAIGEAAAASGDHIPSSFSCRIPNPSKDRTYFTAESWSFWALYIGPIVLRRRFREEKYYTHFVKLVRILHLCLQFNISDDELQEIRIGLAEWAQTYEKLYYQNNLSRLPVCRLTIHGLLHIADSIAALGPPWVYWAFPTERFCGSLLPAVRSRRYPFSNIDRHVYDLAILSQLKLLYGLELDLSERRRKAVSNSGTKPAISKYSAFELMCPKAELAVLGDVRRKTLAALATRYGCDWTQFRDVVPASLPQWGKVRKSNGGDLITARGAIRLHSGARDNSFVRYKLNIDIMAHRPRATPVFTPRTFYGQLLHVFRLQIPSLPDHGIHAETIVFALIQQCSLIPNNNLLNIPYYKQTGTTEVVDLRFVQCAVGRVPDRGIWGIVDRRGVLGNADYIGDEENSDDEEEHEIEY